MRSRVPRCGSDSEDRKTLRGSEKCPRLAWSLCTRATRPSRGKSDRYRFYSAMSPHREPEPTASTTAGGSRALRTQYESITRRLPSWEKGSRVASSAAQEFTSPRSLAQISGSTLARDRCMFRTGSLTRKIWLEGLSQHSSRQERSKSLRLRPLVGELSRSTRLEH